MSGQPVVSLIRPTNRRSWTAQTEQQKNIRSPSTSSQRFPQVDAQRAQPVPLRFKLAGPLEARQEVVVEKVD